MMPDQTDDVVEPTTKQRAAFEAGRAAYVAKFDTTVCPHNIVDADADPQQLARVWLRGYKKAQREAEGPPGPYRTLPEGLPAVAR